MSKLASIPDGSVIRFPGSTRYYLKVRDKDGVSSVVALDNGMLIKTSDLSYFDLSADDAEVVAWYGDWDVYIKRWRIRVHLP